jgi:hypothetical protein
MVITRLSGGLGNQLFQYAYGRHVAFTRREKLALDLGWFMQPHILHSSRKFELNNFSIDARKTSISSSIINAFSSTLYLRDIFDVLTHNKTVTEDMECENKFEFNGIKNIFLKGYWQSQNYFLGIRNLLLQEISPKLKLCHKYFELKNKIEQCEAIAIHVRRGDYVNNFRSASVHGTLPISYYLKAIDLILKNTNYPHFFVFSDDISWVKQHFDFKGLNHIFIEGINSPSAVPEFDLMRSCKHHIIANSSFSWWGAWLGIGAKQIVIAPSQWYANKLTPPNLLPPQWLQINL